MHRNTEFALNICILLRDNNECPDWILAVVCLSSLNNQCYLETYFSFIMIS